LLYLLCHPSYHSCSDNLQLQTPMFLWLKTQCFYDVSNWE
jgi:hypothetical protein